MAGKSKANVRKSLSKKTRFDVFKRDDFTCQYCGAHPPAVILHADHIIAVANGGGDEQDNLVTSCEPCNLGKGARPLSVVPQSLAEKAALVAEREAQLLGYHEVMESRLERIERDLWRVAEEIEPGSPQRGMQRKWTTSIKMFNERLGVHEVLEAAGIARAKFPSGGYRTFLYFCGICWRKLKPKDDGAEQNPT